MLTSGQTKHAITTVIVIIKVINAAGATWHLGRA